MRRVRRAPWAERPVLTYGWTMVLTSLRGRRRGLLAASDGLPWARGRKKQACDDQLLALGEGYRSVPEGRWQVEA